MIFAGGDDFLCFSESPIDYDKYKLVLSDSLYGRRGLGICVRGFKQGYLHEMEFLSKNLVCVGDRIEVYRKADKVA